MYKILSSAVVAFVGTAVCTATVADPGSSVSGSDRYQTQFKSISQTTLPVVKKSREAGKLASRDEVCGYYNYDSFRLTRTFQGWDRSYCLPVIAPGEEDDDLILYGFWADFNDDGTPISAVEAKFDQEKQQIIIPAGASLGTYGDYSAYIYVSDWNTDLLLDEPIILNYDAENRGMTYYCEPNAAGNAPVSCLIVTSYADAVGKVISTGVDFIGAIEMYKYNGSMVLTDVTHSTSGQCLVYIDSTDGGFKVRNFGNRGFRIPLEFKADLSALTCTAQPTLCHKDFTFDNGEVMDLYFAGSDGGPIAGTLEKDPIEENLYTLHIPLWSLYDMAAGKNMIDFSGSYLSVPLTGNSGVAEAIADTADLPVEYFTLQGIRIAHPEKGSLVIRRQGNNVQKILTQ